MPDREKVIKAYECCKNSYDRICEKCPYEKDCCHDGIPMFVIKKMVALLKEQKERLGVLERTIEHMPKPVKLLDVFGDNYEKIVRCKNCRFKECEGRNGLIVCDITGESHQPEWFCADGERRDG